MPPIEMIASPVRDRISIPIPKKYRAYSFYGAMGIRQRKSGNGKTIKNRGRFMGVCGHEI